MAVAGRQPRPAEQKRNRAQSQVDWVEVPDVPYTGDRPELPTTRTVVTRDGQEQVNLQPMTERWWEIVTTMPHCARWSASDWMFALSTAVVADAAFCGVASAQTELRNREKVMGTTAEFRRALRIRYVEPPAAKQPPAEVANLDDYRDL